MDSKLENVSLEISLSENNSIDISDSQPVLNENEKFKSNLLNHYLKHNLTIQCLLDTIKLINSIPNTDLDLPSNKYQCLKLFDNAYKKHYYIWCEVCSKYSKSSSNSKQLTCRICGNGLSVTETSIFVYIDLKEQIFESIKRNWAVIKKYREETLSKDDDFISDISDGKILKTLIRNNTDVFILSLSINTDGAAVYKSKNISIWPVQIILNFLPPDARYKLNNIIVTNLYFGNMPNMTHFLEPLLQELECLQKTFLITFNYESIHFQLYATHCCVDLQAKALLQQIKLYNSHNSCTYCKHPGKSVMNMKTLHKYIRYTSDGTPYAYRKHSDVVAELNHFSIHNQIGLKGRSCMIDVPNFDIIFGFGIDYMHAVLLGVSRTLCELWLGKKNHRKVYYIPTQKQNELNSKLVVIKPCNFVKRKPRSLAHIAKFKAIEFKYLILYYFPIILWEFLPKRFFDHFMLLSSSIYTLLGTKISSSDINNAEEKLRKFVYDFEHLYGEEHVTMCIHLLTHISESVRRHGPLWTQSAFSFESNNGRLMKYVKGPTDALLQIASKYSISKKNFDIIYLGSSFGSEHLSCGRPIPKTFCEDEILAARNCNVLLPNDQIVTAVSIKIRNSLFTSLNYHAAIKSIDYFVQLKNKQLGMVRFYFKHEEKIFVLLNEFGVFASNNHILEVRNLNRIVCANAEDIHLKYIYISSKNKHFIVSAPNSFESD